MEITCSTIGFGMVPLEDALRRIGQLGFTGAEVGVLGDFCPHLDPMADVSETVDHVSGAFTEAGLHPVALNCAPRIYCADPHDAAQLGYVADRLLQIAGGLGCDLILDAGEREQDAARGRRLAAQVVREAFRAGRDHYGVRVSVEAPHRGMNAETVPEALHLLELTGEDGLGITYDTSHATCGGTSVADGLRLLGQRIVRVQARDHRGDDVSVTPGDGEYDWPVLFEFLTGHARPFCLELEFDGRLDADGVALETGRALTFLRTLA